MSAAKTKTCSTYARRSPELTPCYKILQEHLASFLAEREAEGRPLPDYVCEEFEAYLKCGILAYGFLRLQCTSCHEEKIVAFSCKKRGFCPSCCAKRQSEAATHLIDHVLPLVPYRQFVLSFPVPMRYWLQTNRKLYAKIHTIVIEAMHSYYSAKAALNGIKNPAPGSISFTQRWGSALNLNPPLHVLCPDGVYTRVNAAAKFRNIDPITDDEVATLATVIAAKVMRFLKKRGYLNQHGELVTNPNADAIFEENEAITHASSASIAGKIAFGPNAGKYVTRIGPGFGYEEEIPLAKGKRCYSVHGFSLHANTATKTHQRDRLEKLIEYMARGPLSSERLEITEFGKVKLQLKTAWRDGTTHLLFTPGEFIEKLSALIPPPRSHLVRWGGVFSGNSPYRKEITLKPEVKKGFQFGDETDGAVKLIKNYSWSKMLAKVFKIDVSRCDSCGGDMAAVAALTDPDSVKRYLAYIKVDADPPARAPPKISQGSFEFDQSTNDYNEPAISYD